MRRKGLVVDLITIAVFLLVGVLTMLVASKVISDYDTEASKQNIDSYYADQGQRAVNSFNLLGVFIFIGAAISSIALVFQIRTHPIFILPSIILLVVATTTAAIFGNVWTEFFSVNAFSGVTANFALIDTLYSNLPLVLAGLGIVMLIIMFSQKTKDPLGG